MMLPQIDPKNFRRMLIRTLVLPPVLMVALAVVLLWQIDRLLRVEQQVSHTNEVIAQAHEIEKLLVDMETGVRGYLITGKANFLEPYNKALRSIESEFDSLAHLVSDNPAQGQRLEELRAEHRQWEAYAREVIYLRDSGGDYQSYVGQALGKGMMDEMRAQIASFIKIEEGLRDERTRATQRTTQRVIVIGLSLTLLVGILLAFFARRQLIAVSQSYGQALTAAHEQTEALRAKSEELSAMTQQFWQTSKLATVGELAASIAHELNNPLATISLRTESLLAQAAKGDPRRRPLEIIDQEAERMGNLVSNLLQFSRRSHQQISTFDVRKEIDNAIEFIHYHLHKNLINVEREFADTIPTVHADRQQLRQLFLNLVMNASDAMPQGGRLTLRVAAGRMGSGVGAVVIEFTDTGAGIAPDDLAKVWEPFFTTKPEGKGTGLGLAICRRIVEEHRGTIHIESEVGAGTTVRIMLPEANGEKRATHGM
jgi:signal transduction histidine kinase